VRFVWGAVGARRAAVQALRNGEQIELECRGWRARVGRSFLPRLISRDSRLRVRDLFAHVALLRIATLVTYWMYSRNRTVSGRSEGESYVLTFE
jgi:hypothetical protein